MYLQNIQQKTVKDGIFLAAKVKVYVKVTKHNYIRNVLLRYDYILNMCTCITQNEFEEDNIYKAVLILFKANVKLLTVNPKLTVAATQSLLVSSAKK